MLVFFYMKKSLLLEEIYPISKKIFQLLILLSFDYEVCIIVKVRKKVKTLFSSCIGHGFFI
jgi:hypothetical protein